MVAQSPVKEVNQMRQLPDPKELVDSVADGAVEIAEGPARVAMNLASVCQDFASGMKTNMDNLKSRLPDDPSVIADAGIKAVGETVQAGIGIFEGIGKGVLDTVSAVKNQIRRVTG